MERFTLKNLRLSKKLDETFLARYFNCRIEEIQALEQDSSEISDEMLQKYLAYFRLSYDAIYLGETSKEEQEVQERESQKLVLFFQKFFHENASKFNFYSYFSLIFQLPVIAQLHQIVVLVVQFFYFVIVRVILTGKSKNSRYILSYLMILLERFMKYKWVKGAYISLALLPNLLGLFVFHELPHNFFGYTYSWPITLCGTFATISIWKKVALIYNDNLKNFLNLLERYYIFLFRLYIPISLFLLMIGVINQSFSSPYTHTIVFISFNTSLNYFLIAVSLVLFFLPVIDMDYQLPALKKDFLPFSTFMYGLAFLFFQFMCGPIYGRDFEPFYISSINLFVLFWLSYLLMRYRMSLGNSQDFNNHIILVSKKTFHLLLVITIFYAAFLMLVAQMYQLKLVISLDLVYCFVPILFIVSIFSFLFLFLNVRANKVKNI